MEEISVGEFVNNSVAPAESSSACARARVGLLAELTHRCPLQCPYCSNPLELERPKNELTTADWQDVLRQASDLGVLQTSCFFSKPPLYAEMRSAFFGSTC